MIPPIGHQGKPLGLVGPNVKADKQKIIVDEQPDSKRSQQKMKDNCEKNHMKWDDTAKKCSK